MRKWSEEEKALLAKLYHDRVPMNDMVEYFTNRTFEAIKVRCSMLGFKGRPRTEEHKRKMPKFPRGNIPWNKGTTYAKGESNPNWKGGRRIKSGYVLVWCPGHPRADKNSYVPEHVLVAEKKLNRQLRKGEIVHHINGKKQDNHPDNLHVFPNVAEHMRHHGLERGRRKKHA